MKLFKNIPRTDLEMVFPNTKCASAPSTSCVSASRPAAVSAWAPSAQPARSRCSSTNPIAAAGALVGLGAIAFRQAMSFINQKQQYMVVMAQNLYFHAMADNRGVILKIAARAAEEDIKEEMLLYSVLAKEKANRADLPAIDAARSRPPVRGFGTCGAAPTRSRAS